MRAKKFGMSFETQGNETLWWDVPGFCRDIPEAPEKFEKKSLCSIFVPHNFLWSEIQNYIAEADADSIPVPGQLELHSRCRCGVLLSPCFGALFVADLSVGMEELELHCRCRDRLILLKIRIATIVFRMAKPN